MRLIRVAAVIENCVVVAASILKRIRENRHRAEVARIVHLLGKGKGDGAIGVQEGEKEKETGRNGLPNRSRRWAH